MSDNKQDDADTLSALVAAARQKADSMSAAAQTKYNEASAQAANMVNAAKEGFNQGMQKADQLADAAKAKFNDGMEAARQLANDTKAKFESGVHAAQDMAADAKVKLEKGLADAKQQGGEMLAAAKDRVQSASLSNLPEKVIAVEAGKQVAGAGAEALGFGSHVLTGTPGSQDVAKAWQSFQDAGGMPVAKMMVEQKLEDAGIRSTDATINKMADASKSGADNDFNRLNTVVEQDAKLGKGPDEVKPASKPQGPESSKFLSDDLKAKYLARAQDMGQDTKQAATKWETSNQKPPQNQNQPAPSTPGPSTQQPAASPSPKP